MKFVFCYCLLAVFSVAAQAQKGGSLNARGGRNVGFNVDADTRAGQAKIFPADSSYYFEDDWFKTPDYTGRGKGVIDVSDAANLRAQLEGGANISFTKRMSTPPYDILFYVPPGSTTPTPQFWVDGVYFRDFVGNDQTAFLTGAKNGSNPNTWNSGTTLVSNKADIIDAYCHVRTSGRDPVKDSVWFFAGVATLGTDGARYFDIEVYREPMNITGGKFVSQGTSYGHSHWAFDVNSNITQTGDLVISVAYANTGAPEIDFRIWLKKSTYDSITTGKIVPKNFKIQGKWDAADDPNFGYAQITAPNETDEWGTGLGNYTGNANTVSDSTFSTPWGTINTKGKWSPYYDQLQFVEISLNFSRFGMNPFSYVTSFCKSPYSSILFKSRNSPEFNASLNDFVGPMPFSVKDMAPFDVTPEVLTCTKTTSKLQFTYQARNYYRLLNENGDTLAKDIDFFMYPEAARYLPVTNAGTYRIEATNFQGCPTMGHKTITVLKDDIAPDAQILVGNQGPYYQLRSNTTTPASSFGASQGYNYAWSGPAGSELSSYTDAQPLITTYVQGNYDLTVTELRNGCTATARAYIMGVLNSGIQLQAKAVNNEVALSWNNPNAQAKTFTIERSYDGTNFEKVGQVNSIANTTNMLHYLDAPEAGRFVFYRIKNSKGDGSSNYSNIAHVKTGAPQQKVTLYKNSNSIQVNIAQIAAKNAHVQIVDITGRMLLQHYLPLQNGFAQASLMLPAVYQNKPVVVTVWIDGQLLQAKKVL